MTDVIQLLPDSVANQIAAGEVIQRPASVIKELVENAIDAGATSIDVIIVDAGRTSMQVVDNGCGMSETDARLAFERHATSKIRKADDLFTLRTMGFRGEALPSIAAVAQVELRTRRATDELGTSLTLSGSRVMGQEPCSCAVGSSFTVSNLFFNVPARRKFLKSNATELANIVTTFERIVLVYPQVAFTLHSNGQELMNLRSGSLRQRITDVLGRRYSQDLLPVDADTQLCRISGFVGKPEAARQKAAHEYFFANGRYMRHPYFHKAVLQAYERLVPTGARVPYFIYIDVEPQDIDVNIHPTKTEIKFENEQPIYQLLTAAVREAIGKFCEIPSIDFDTEGRPDIPLATPQLLTQQSMPTAPQPRYNPGYNPFRQKASQDWQRLYGQLPSADQPDAGQLPLFGDDATAAAGSAVTAETTLVAGSPAATAAITQYQYKGTYILAAVKSGLMFIDQHRADIRVRYDRYLAQLTDAPATGQRLLFPEAVELTAAEGVLMEQMLPMLSAMGFALQQQTDTSYLITAVPTDIDGLQPSAVVRQLIEAGGQDAASADGSPMRHSLALALARQSAIPYGQVLSNEEMDTLVNQLFACSDVNHTPDGHTIIAILPQADIDSLF